MDCPYLRVKLALVDKSVEGCVQTEISYSYIIESVEQKVLGFEVSVYDSLIMAELQAIHKLDEKVPS